MNNPLVSILIPVYNREELIIKSIDSSLKQTYNNIEIIIVDNCSKDNTWKLLQDYAKKDKRIKVFRNDKNIGPVLNWKRCLEEAKGEYAKLLFSDDLISDNFIKNSLSVFDKNVAFVISEIEIFNNHKVLYNQKQYKNRSYSVKKYFEEILLYNNIVFSVSPGSALFRTKDIRKSLLVEIPNEFNLDFKRFGAGTDLLIFLLVAKDYSKINISKDTKAYFRSHDNSFTTSNDLDIYYNYSKYYFIKQFYPKLLSRFKSVLWIYSIKNNKKDEILNLIPNNISLLFLIKMILMKVFKLVIYRF